MNKKIEKFAKQSQIEIWGTNEINGSPKFLGHDIDVEKFAELIVEECVRVCLDQRDPSNLNYKPSEKFAEEIKKHFGVKE